MAEKVAIKDGRTVSLRPAVERDAPALVHAIDSVAREQKYLLRSRFEVSVEEERAIIARARAQGNLILLAILDGELVGWLSLFRGRHEFRRHTGQMGISVVRGYRGLGIGTALMVYALDWAAKQGLEKINLGVRISNERARALYCRFGFVEEGYRVREIKDLHGRYHDSVDMAYFVAPDSVPDKQGQAGGQRA
jgi:RimJ/RimL family protein N-acetyltransferase